MEMIRFILPRCCCHLSPLRRWPPTPRTACFFLYTPDRAWGVTVFAEPNVCGRRRKAVVAPVRTVCNVLGQTGRFVESRGISPSFPRSCVGAAQSLRCLISGPLLLSYISSRQVLLSGPIHGRTVRAHLLPGPRSCTIRIGRHRPKSPPSQHISSGSLPPAGLLIPHVSEASSQSTYYQGLASFVPCSRTCLVGTRTPERPLKSQARVARAILPT